MIWKVDLSILCSFQFLSCLKFVSNLLKLQQDCKRYSEKNSWTFWQLWKVLKEFLCVKEYWTNLQESISDRKVVKFHCTHLNLSSESPNWNLWTLTKLQVNQTTFIFHHFLRVPHLLQKSHHLKIFQAKVGPLEMMRIQSCLIWLNLCECSPNSI